MKRALVSLNIFMIMIFLIIGCGDDKTELIPQSEVLIEEGWKEYIAGYYDLAIAKFQSVINEDSNNAEAYNGIGWSKAKLGQIEQSIDSFKSAIAKDPSKADSHAGLAGIYLAIGDYERAIASANRVISIDPKYVSFHDDIDIRNIRLILAEAYYYRKDYTNARNQIELLGNTGKTLDPGSPTYEKDLMLVIEEKRKKRG